MVNQESLKDFFKNLKKGAQAGVLGAALVAGTTMGVGCANDGNTMDDTQITNPGITNPGNTNYGEQPYDRAVGNGNYIFHNFISNNHAPLTSDNRLDVTNHYLGLGRDYIVGMANKFDATLSNRDYNTQRYFGLLINTIKTDNYSKYFKLNRIDNNYMDYAATLITKGTEDIMADIVKNLNNLDEREAFSIAYRVLANEAYSEGLGSNYYGTARDSYKKNKEYYLSLSPYSTMMNNMGMNLEDEYNKNNFTKLTNLTDQLLATAAQNISNRQNMDVRTADLRQVVNANLAAHGLRGMHASLNLDHQCVMALSDVSTIIRTDDQVTAQEQQQSQNYSM